MYKSLALIVIALLAACNMGTPPQSHSAKPMGLLKVNITTAGDAYAQWVGGVRDQAVSVKPINGNTALDDVQFAKNAVGTYDDLINNRRYVVTTFSLTNRTTTAFNNFTLYAVNVPGTTQAGTGIVSIKDVAENSITNEAVYRGFQPSHSMGPGVGGLQVSAPIADLQWITQAEASDAQNQAIIPNNSSVLEYGFVARNLNNQRTINARNTPTDCTDSSCKGSITLTYSFPIQTPASANPFRFTLYFVAADESDSHISQSLEEQTPNTIAGLTSSSGFLQSRILSGSSFGLGQSNLNNLCQVKTAVPSALNPNFVLLPSSVPTAAGTLDTCFGSGGKVTTDFGLINNSASALAIQGDGKIVVAGYSYSSNDGNAGSALVRYNTNGTLDTTFGTGGKVTTAIGSSTALALQPDGKIVVAGISSNGSNNSFALARYNPNGSLDTTFDSDGKVTTDFGTGSGAYALALQPDGKIVAAGSNYNLNSNFALARYNANGSLDTAFDSDGMVTTDFGFTDDAAYALALQPDGKIVAAGHTWNGGDDFALVRYNANGSLDTNFDSDGMVTTVFSFSSDDDARALALQPDGKIVVAGYVFHDQALDPDFALARYNPNGSLDTTFGSDGMVYTGFPTIYRYTDDQAYGLALQPDGKIVVAGYSLNENGEDVALVRYNANGSLDTNFDGDGKVTTPIGTSSDRANALAIQGDGKIVVAGYSYNYNDRSSDIALFRYNP